MHPIANPATLRPLPVAAPAAGAADAAAAAGGGDGAGGGGPLTRARESRGTQRAKSLRQIREPLWKTSAESAAVPWSVGGCAVPWRRGARGMWRRWRRSFLRLRAEEVAERLPPPPPGASKTVAIRRIAAHASLLSRHSYLTISSFTPFTCLWPRCSTQSQQVPGVNEGGGRRFRETLILALALFCTSVFARLPKKEKVHYRQEKTKTSAQSRGITLHSIVC